MQITENINNSTQSVLILKRVKIIRLMSKKNSPKKCCFLNLFLLSRQTLTCNSLRNVTYSKNGFFFLPFMALLHGSTRFIKITQILVNTGKFFPVLFTCWEIWKKQKKMIIQVMRLLAVIALKGFQSKFI